MAKQQTASRRKARPEDNGSEKGKSGSGDKASSYEEELTELLQERIKPGLNRGSIPLLARSLAKDIASRQRPDEAEDDDEPRDEASDEQPETDEDAEAGDERDEEPEADAGEDSAADEAPDEEPEDEDAEDDDEDREPEAEAEDEELEDEDEESEEEEEDGGDDPVSAFEEEMHQLQEDLGDEWIVRFSVQNDEAWLTAEKEDGSQHVEGPTADVLREAVELLEGGDEE